MRGIVGTYIKACEVCCGALKRHAGNSKPAVWTTCACFTVSRHVSILCRGVFLQSPRLRISAWLFGHAFPHGRAAFQSRTGTDRL